MAVHAGLSALHAAAGVGWVDDGLTTDTLTYCVWQGAMCAAGQTGSILVSSHPCLCCGRSMHSRHDLWAQLRACAWHEEATCRTRHAAAQGVAAQGTPSVGQQPARCVACGWYKPQANGSDTASMPYALSISSPAHADACLPFRPRILQLDLSPSRDQRQHPARRVLVRSQHRGEACRQVAAAWRMHQCGCMLSRSSNKAAHVRWLRHGCALCAVPSGCTMPMSAPGLACAGRGGQ